MVRERSEAGQIEKKLDPEYLLEKQERMLLHVKDLDIKTTKATSSNWPSSGSGSLNRTLPGNI